MAFYPYVNKGDRFQPSVKLENNIREIVNGHLKTGTGHSGKTTGNSVRIQVWNTTREKLPAGSAVSIFTDEKDYRQINGVLPCEAYTGDNRMWGILPDSLQPGSAGDCIIGGIAEVNSNQTVKPGDNILPVIGGRSYALVPAGAAEVIHSDGKNATVKFHGDDLYHGYFKIALMNTRGSTVNTE